MKTKAILAKLEEGLPHLEGLAGVFGVVVPPQISMAVNLASYLIGKFRNDDPEKDWTPEEINAAADAAIAEVQANDPHFVKDDSDD